MTQFLWKRNIICWLRCCLCAAAVSSFLCNWYQPKPFGSSVLSHVLSWGDDVILAGQKWRFIRKMWRCGDEIQLFLVSQTDEAECRSNSHHVTHLIFNSQQWLKSSTWCGRAKLSPLTRPWLVFDSNNIKYVKHESSVCVRKSVLFGSCVRKKHYFSHHLGIVCFHLTVSWFLFSANICRSGPGSCPKYVRLLATPAVLQCVCV